MSVNTLSFEQLVQNEIAAVQAALPNSFIFGIGSIVRALVDADCTNALWLESFIQYVQSITRLATSQGTDVDSYLADFGLTRLPATYASGAVTFARYTPLQQAVVPVDAQVSSSDGTVSFIVYADANNSNYNPSLDGYVLAPNVASISVPVKATTAGTIGNVIANAITVINSSIPGVDTVTNPVPFNNGFDSQSDAAARAYFVAYLNSLSRANQDGIAFAIVNADTSIAIEYNLVENTNYTTGDQQLGYFYAVIDDGTGSPSSNLLQTITSAINAYRGLAIQFGVFAVTVLDATISATIVVPQGTNSGLQTQLHNDIINGLYAYADQLGIGSTMYYSRIIQIIYDVIMQDAPGLINQINVTSVLLNSGTSDLVATAKQSIYITSTPTITITVA